MYYGKPWLCVRCVQGKECMYVGYAREIINVITHYGQYHKKHRLNMTLDLQSIFGLLCTAVLIGWDPATPPSNPHLSSYARAPLVSKDRCHLFVTPCTKRQGAFSPYTLIYVLFAYSTNTQKKWEIRRTTFLLATIPDEENEIVFRKIEIEDSMLAQEQLYK